MNINQVVVVVVVGSSRRVWLVVQFSWVTAEGKLVSVLDESNLPTTPSTSYTSRFTQADDDFKFKLLLMTQSFVKFYQFTHITPAAAAAHPLAQFKFQKNWRQLFENVISARRLLMLALTGRRTWSYALPRKKRVDCFVFLPSKTKIKNIFVSEKMCLVL